MGSGTDSHADVGSYERGRIIDSVPDKKHVTPLAVKFFHKGFFALGRHGADGVRKT